MKDSLAPLNDDQVYVMATLLYQSFNEVLFITKPIFEELFADIVNMNNDSMMFNISLALNRQYPDMIQAQNSLMAFKVMHVFMGKMILKFEEVTNNRGSYESTVDLTRIFYNWLRLAITPEESRDSSSSCNPRRQDDRGLATVLDITRIKH